MSAIIAEPSLTWAGVAPATPEIYLTAALCAVLLVEAFAGEKRRGLADTLTLIVLLGGALLTAACAHVTQRTTLFHGLYVADELAYVLKLAGFSSSPLRSSIPAPILISATFCAANTACFA